MCVGVYVCVLGIYWLLSKTKFQDTVLTCLVSVRRFEKVVTVTSKKKKNSIDDNNQHLYRNLNGL